MCFWLVQRRGRVCHGVCLQWAWRALSYHQGHWSEWEYYRSVSGMKTPPLNDLFFQEQSKGRSLWTHTAALHLDVCVHRCVSRLMWVAQPKAPLPIQCVSSSHGTLVPRGTSWCLFVPEAPSPPHCAPPNFTLRASISLAQHTAGEGRSFTLENFISVGKDRSTKINDHKTELSH